MENPNPSTNQFRQFKSVDKLVYLVTGDDRFGVLLADQISHFGYFVKVVNNLPHLQNAIAEHVSVAILIDISSLNSTQVGVDIFEDLSTNWQGNIPLMFISDYNDQDLRLSSICANGVAFFIKPLDISSLVEKLDSVQIQSTTERQRILIVEDQLPIANFYQMVLKLAGMDAELITDPGVFLRKTMDYRPDLILMDLYMPSTNGFQLTKMLRQIDEFISTPIVFLSSEDDFDRRMEAMHLGGDDLLIKPIKAAQLVELVKSRLERLRVLRAYMVQDSLTGLLNHTTFRSMLAQEVSYCQRQNGRLALAMIDLDHFKDVNDIYGHSSGDSILKSLSRLLKQRLRKTDLVGRYGGEEFVALLRDVDDLQALM